MNSIASLPLGSPARLAATYDAAKHVLAACPRANECQEWADKAEALASYARPGDVQTLREMAYRIQARAIRRCGELLQQIELGQGVRVGKRQEGTHPPLTRTQATTNAGLPEHHRKTDLRVASVPANSFEAVVESDNPPTVTQLADQAGKMLINLGNTKPANFAIATIC